MIFCATPWSDKSSSEIYLRPCFQLENKHENQLQQWLFASLVHSQIAQALENIFDWLLIKAERHRDPALSSASTNHGI